MTQPSEIRVSPFVWDAVVHCVPRWHVHAAHEPSGAQCWLDDCCRPTREEAEELLFTKIEEVCEASDMPYLRSEWLLLHCTPLGQN